MTEPKRIDIKEFRALGFLQEANRQFFHPLGLALEVVVEEDGSERLGGVWDYRDDPEGILYSDDQLSAEKARRVKAERDSHVGPRIALIKAVVQMVPRESS